jgi:hypothetical protein
MYESYIIYHGTRYKTVWLDNFKTADGEEVEEGTFIEDSFELVRDGNEDLFRVIDESVYGYLPKEIMLKSEEKIRKYIKKNIG